MSRTKLLTILALLFVAATGAWAETPFLLASVEAASDQSFRDGSKTFDDKVTITFSGQVYNFSSSGWTGGTFDQTLTVSAVKGYSITSCVFYMNGSTEGYTINEAPFMLHLIGGYVSTEARGNGTVLTEDGGITKIDVYAVHTPPVTGVTLSHTTATVAGGKTLTLTPTVLPAEADQTVTWSTSNSTVATVANGVVTAKSNGTATITVTATNGTDATSDDKTATCAVTVIGIAEGTYIRMGSYNGEYVDWFAARSNGNGWMMLSKYVLKNMTFGSNSTYTQSNIYKWLDADAGGTFEDELGLTATERSLVKTVNLSSTNGDGTDRFIIPTRGDEQPNGSPYTKAYFIYDKSTSCSRYWLREARDASNVRVINFSDETVTARYSGSGNNNGVRPMFYLDTDALASLSLTGSGTEEDPYVFEPRYDIALDITSSAEYTLSATATRDGKTIFRGGLPNKLVAGATVTLTITPAKGYSVKDFTVTSGGTPLSTTGEGDTRTFTMPTANVAVAVTIALNDLQTDETGAYLIGSADDWEVLCINVNNGKTFSGETVKMTADISGVSTRSSKDKAFSGTFDGQGNTLNLNINVSTDEETSAPFGWINGATIKNLHITGSETTAGKRYASIAGFAQNSTITNCWSEVALSSSRANWVDGGAFVGRIEKNSTLTLNGCLFTGSITYSNAAGYEGGGMVGWRNGTAVLNNCVFAPSAVTATKYDGLQMFVGNGGATLNNCYYNDVAAATSLTVQGMQAFSITAGDDVAINGLGAATDTYDISGITAYNKGVKYNGTYYAGNGEAVTLNLSPAVPYFVISEYTVTGGGTLTNATTSTPTLTMTDAGQVISATGDYSINSKSHWEAFCTAVNGGTTYEGKTIHLGADISGATTMVGTNEANSFQGIFDGQGNTLNVNITDNSATPAPFLYIKNATIRNLVVTGSISSNKNHTAGLAKSTYGNILIENCNVAATISGAQYMGGFLGHTGPANITLRGCVFSGTLSPTGSNYTGGLIGWGDGTAGINITIADCLFNGTLDGSSTAKFHPVGCAYRQNLTGTISNMYYAVGPTNMTDDDGKSIVKPMASKGKQAFSITVGDDVTSLAISGDPTAAYNVSGITTYAKGIKYGDVCYAANGEEVGLALTHSEKEGYVFYKYSVSGGGTLANPTTDSPVLTMNAANNVVSAEYLSMGTVALNVIGNGGTASLMDVTFKPLTATDKMIEGDKFVLNVVKDDGYDFNVTLSTGGDAKDFLQEFSKEEYESYIAYAKANNINITLNSVMMWVTMPYTSGDNLTMTLGFPQMKAFTVLYQPSDSPENVWCRFGTMSNNVEHFDYAKMTSDAAMGDGTAVWSLKVSAAFDPSKVAFFTSEEAAKSEGAAMSNAVVSQAADSWTAISGGRYLLIGGNAKTVVAAFVAEANTVPMYNSENVSFDVEEGNPGVTYQMTVCLTDGDGNVTSAGNITIPAALKATAEKEFVAWSGLEGTAPYKTEQTYTEGQQVSISENTVFYAVWKPTTLTASLNLNGGTGIDSNSNVTYGETLTISEPTRKGFAFDGWTVSNSVTEYGQLFSKGAPFALSTPITANLGLTAQWKHVHDFIYEKISKYQEELPEYQKYNKAYHFAECSCDVFMMAHNFNSSGKCACGYTKPMSATDVALDVSYGQWANNSYTEKMMEASRFAKKNQEVTVNAPHEYGSLEFSKWQYSTNNGASWHDLTSYEIVSFIIPCNMKMRALYVNPVTAPQVDLSARQYDDQAVVDGQTYTMDNVLFQMNYKLPDGYSFEDAGVRLGDNAGISYYELKERTYTMSAEMKAIGVAVCVVTSIIDGGINTFDGSSTQKYYAERENSVLDEMSAQTLSEYMYQSKPVNVEKYKPIYWEAKAPTKGMCGSVNTMAPLRFIQKNNGNHWIYGIGYLRYKKPNGNVETIYTPALPTTRDNIPAYTVTKSGQQATGARQMAPAQITAQSIEVIAARRAPENSSEENLDFTLVSAPETQLTVYVDNEWSATLSDRYGFGDKATVSAPEVNGKTFSHWEADGQPICTSNTLTLTMNAHTTLFAVYDGSAQASPTAGFTSVTRSNDGSKISFQAIADAQASAAGILYSTTATGVELTINGEDVTQVAAERLTDASTTLPASVLDGNNCWMLQVTPEDENTIYHARVYATIGGTTTYSDVRDVKLADLESGISRIANLDGLEDGINDKLTELRNSTLILNEIMDNSDALAEWDSHVANVTLKRTLQTGSWNTFAVPFNVDVTTMASLGFSAVKELDSATLEGQTLTLNFKDATTIEAGKPYLVKVDANVENPTFDGVTISKEAAPYTSTIVDFIPTLGKTTITGDDAKTILFLASGNLLKNPAAMPAYMKGFRAYFQLKNVPAAARSFALNLGDEETGIQFVATESQPSGQEAHAYDLQGRKLQGQPTKKGVYIVNGKKTIK